MYTCERVQLLYFYLRTLRRNYADIINAIYSAIRGSIFSLLSLEWVARVYFSIVTHSQKDQIKRKTRKRETARSELKSICCLWEMIAVYGFGARKWRGYLREVEWRSLQSSGTSSQDRSWTIFCRCRIDRRAGRELGGTNSLSITRTCQRNTPAHKRSEPSELPRPPRQHRPRYSMKKRFNNSIVAVYFRFIVSESIHLKILKANIILR